MMKKAVLFIICCSINILFAGEITVYNTSNSGLIDDQVNAVYVDQNGTAWFGTASGICSFNGSEWNNQEAAVALQGVYVNDIDYQESSYGPELWFATSTGAGVGSFELDAITSATRYRAESSDLVSDSVTTVNVDPHNARWFGTANAGVSVFAGSDWYTFSKDNYYLGSNRITTIASGPDSFHYIGTLDDGVNRLIYNDDIDAITTASAYSKTWSAIDTAKVYDILVLDNGDQWFATNNGLMFHDTTETKRGWHRFSPQFNNVADMIIKAIAEDANGNIWVATPNGVSYVETGDYMDILYETAQFTSLTAADGLPDNDVRDIAVDTTNNIVWFATPNGVASFSGIMNSVKDESPNQGPRSWQLLSNYPNPFNPSTNISFTLEADSHVTLDIYNINGQLVQHLADSRYSAGSYFIPWNGLDAQGTQVNSGVYFARLYIDTGIHQLMDSHKMLLVR